MRQKLSTIPLPAVLAQDGVLSVDAQSLAGRVVTIFANPIAGRGRGTALADRLVKKLQDEGATTHLFLERPADIHVERIPPQGAATIVIGGDGTLRAVIERFYLTGEPRPSLLVVPMGTANLMGRHLGMKWNARNLERVVVGALRARNLINMDCALANGLPLIVMAGVGFDAQVVQAVARNRRGPIRYASYVIPTLGAFARYGYPQIEVTLDGRRIFGPAPGLAFVGNIREYGTGFPVLPHARADDQLLDVCVLPCANKADLVKWGALAAAGWHVGSSGCVYEKGKSVQITSPSSAPVQVDGEDAGTTPFNVELLPHSVPFFVPREE